MNYEQLIKIMKVVLIRERWTSNYRKAPKISDTLKFRTPEYLL